MSGDKTGPGGNAGASTTQFPTFSSFNPFGKFNPLLASMARLTPLEKKAKNPDLNIVQDASMEAFVKTLQEKGCKKVIVMTGAGISTSAGIPDFRSPSTGLYANLAKYNLPYPEAVFSINYFRKSPQPFFTLAKELYPGCFKPTLCHYFIKLLSREGILLRCYTQNIDTLERVAGIDDNLIVEAHGSFASARCVGRYRRAEPTPDSTASSPTQTGSDSDSDLDDIAFHLEETDFKACGKAFSQEWVKERVFRNEIPECDRCQGLVKPDITFFGESLPQRFHAMIVQDFSQADALIIIGTSLKVQPFAGLINRVKPSVPRLLINMEMVGVEDSSTTRGFDFDGDRHEYRRDAVYLGTADSGCERLAQLLGLDKKLQELIQTENAKFDGLHIQTSAVALDPSSDCESADTKATLTDGLDDPRAEEDSTQELDTILNELKL